jgi:hypothetical protein
MKKIILPAVIIGLAVGAAFATQKTDSSSKRAQVAAFRFDVATETCVNALQQCSDIISDPCIWSVDEVTELHRLSTDPTMCGDPLYKL